MGKSPGKWIKTVFFGKKSSKSNLSKNATPDKKAALKTQAEDNSPVISDPQLLAEKDAENIEREKGTSADSSTVNQGLEPQSNFVSVPLSDDEMTRQGQAATKAQTAFRGYLARRAFLALKGIIRLQALIRGHLVRRQAVATLRCMQAIVKLQALARAQRVDIGPNSIFGSGKLPTNAYVRKLLSLPAVMPLSLQYDTSEPNSAWNWLERWSLSRFWDPPPHPRKVSNIKPHNKQSGSKNAENELGKSKRTTRKASTGDNGALSSFKTDNKSKRNPKKAQMEFGQEHAQNELDRVKRSLRKVSASVTSASEKPEMENEKPDNFFEGKIVISIENCPDSGVLDDKLDFLEAPSQPMSTDELVNDGCLLVETHSSEIGGKIESSRFSHNELSTKECWSRKIRKRRSLPEYSENISLNTPSLPSYMMATESAKAKLRTQGPAKLISEDRTENGYVRRHSLPASTNGKISSLSPRVQNRVHGNDMGGNSKSSRLMASSKDDKVLQPGWRR